MAKLAWMVTKIRYSVEKPVQIIAYLTRARKTLVQIPTLILKLIG